MTWKLTIIVISIIISNAMLFVGCSSLDNHNQVNTSSNNSKINLHKAALLNVELGEKYLAQGQRSRAKEKLIHALEIEPNLPQAHSALGFYYETVGDGKYAEQHYRQAISYGKGKGSFYNNYGTFLCRAKRYKEADKAFMNAVADKNYVKTAEVYENAGLCALSYDDNIKADKYLRLALRYDPYCTIAPLELSKIALENKEYDESARLLQHFKQHHEHTAASLWLSIQLNHKLDLQDKLASDILLFKNMFNNSPEYQVNLKSPIAMNMNE